MLEVCGPQKTTQHVAVPEPTLAERQGLELEDMWQRWSPPQPGGEVWSRGRRGSAGAHLSQEVRFRAHLYREARSEAIGHVVARGCTPCYFS
jgi:hypothetical protein